MDLLLLWKGGASQAGLPQASKPAAPWSAKDHTREEAALQGVGPRVRLSRQVGLSVPGVPTQAPILITPEEGSSDSTHGHHQMVNTEIILIILFSAKDKEDLCSQQKQDQELTVAQIMNSLLPNIHLN